MVPTPLSAPNLAIVAVATLVAGAVRGFAGFGAGMMLIPLVSALFGPKIGASALLVTDGMLTFPYFLRALPHCQRQSVVPVCIAAVATIPLGAQVLVSVDPTPIRWAIAGVIACLLALVVSGWRYHQAPTPVASLGVGAVAGFLSGLIQISGPPVVAFWISGPAPAPVIRANIFAFFGVTTAMAAITYAIDGIFQRELLPVVAVMVPCYGAGLFLGGRVFKRSNERVFRNVAVALIALAVVASLPIFDAWLR